MSPGEIAEAIDFLVNSPDHAKQMREGIKQTVHKHSNYSIEEEKLIDLFATLAKDEYT